MLVVHFINMLNVYFYVLEVVSSICLKSMFKINNILDIMKRRSTVWECLNKERI